MTIVILPSAKADLADGFAFFEEQQAGLGVYFLESLFSDIDSLKIYAGVHRRVFGYSADELETEIRQDLESAVRLRAK